MKPSTKRHRWTKKALLAEVDKLDDEVEIYWDYRDELSNEDIERILEEGEEGLDAVDQGLLNLNMENLFENKDRLIEDRLDEMRKKHSVPRSVEDRFKELVEESEKLRFSANVKGLACKTEADFVVVMNEPELSYQAWRGVVSKGQVDELCKMFELLNVNPVHFQKWVSADNDNRPSYDPDPVIFPDHPERDGNEYVTLEHVHDIMNETSYGGRLLFMVRMKVSDLLEDIEAFRKGPLKVHKGTWCFPYCFMNGAGPCAEMILQKDLVLAKGTYELQLDAGRRYGVQSCYAFTGEPWKAGNITTVDKPEEETKS